MASWSGNVTQSWEQSWLCRLSSVLQEVFHGVFQFFLLLKNQHIQTQIHLLSLLGFSNLQLGITEFSAPAIEWWKFICDLRVASLVSWHTKKFQGVCVVQLKSKYAILTKCIFKSCKMCFQRGFIVDAWSLRITWPTLCHEKEKPFGD